MFKGFPLDALKYFKDIARNNKREWYMANKERYAASVDGPAKELVNVLNGHKNFKKLNLSGSVKQALFRMARDTRFSSNKLPYKTYNGFSLSRSAVKGDVGVFYFNLQPGACFLFAGFWQPDPKFVSRLRLRAVESPDSFKKMIAQLKKVGLTFETDDTLKRAPRGFEHIADEPVKSFIRLKSFYVSEALTDKDITSARLIERAATFVQRARPLLEFGWPVVDEWRREGGDVDFLEKVEKARTRRFASAKKV